MRHCISLDHRERKKEKTDPPPFIARRDVPSASRDVMGFCGVGIRGKPKFTGMWLIISDFENREWEKSIERGRNPLPIGA